MAAPIAPDQLPAQLSFLVSPAAAQTPDPDADEDADEDEPDYVTGTPAACPTTPAGWVAQSGNCVLNIPVPCPTGYPDIALSFPMYCYSEATGASTKPPECSNPTVSNAVVISVNDLTCRIHVLRTCPAGVLLQEGWRDGTDWDADNDDDADAAYDSDDDGVIDDEHAYWRCKAIQRRSWTCPDGYFASNTFNSCYRPAAEASAEGQTHPACDTAGGAPAFTVIECRNYVGDDYDDSRSCSSVSSHFTAVTGGDSARFWCTFDAANLRVDCNRSAVPRGTDCSTNTAYCVMRASRTGGCDTILRTLTCAGLQAAYIDASASDKRTASNNARNSGCSPCLSLPFVSASANCPDEITSQPVYNFNYRDENSATRNLGAHRKGGSASCQDTPPGRIEQHLVTGNLAVVNADIIFTFEDIPEFGYGNAPRFGSRLTNDEVVRLARIPGGTQTSWQDVGECHVRFVPAFFIKIEELWPNTTDHRTRITDLFGAEALDWWNALSTEDQTQLTQDRGNLYSGETDCDFKMPIWCKWRPDRPGYYSVTGVTISYAAEESYRLRDPDSDSGLARDQETNERWNELFPITWQQRGYASQLCTYAETRGVRYRGRASSGSQIADFQGNQITIYYDARKSITKVIDSNGTEINVTRGNGRHDEFRVLVLLGILDPAVPRYPLMCGHYSEYGIYTETEPIGVQVNEVRVLTRNSLR